MDGDIDLVVEEVPVTVSLRASQNGTLRRASTHNEDTFTPPDGGTRAWLVMIGSFLCNGILFGVINSYSVFHSEIYEDLKNKNVSEANSKAGKKKTNKKDKNERFSFRIFGKICFFIQLNRRTWMSSTQFTRLGLYLTLL